MQQFAMWTVCNLAVAGDDIRRRLKKTGFEELAKMAIEMFPENPEVMRHARNTIGVLNPSMVAAAGVAASGGAKKLKNSKSASALSSPMHGKR